MSALIPRGPFSIVEMPMARPPSRFMRDAAPDVDFVCDVEPGLLDQGLAEVLRVLESDTYDRAPTCWIAGGAVRDAVAGEVRRDIDVFFIDVDHHTDAVEAWMRGHGPFGATLIEADAMVSRFDTDVGRVELVRAKYPTALSVIQRFDYTACACAVDVLGRVTRHVDFYDHVAARRLVVNALNTPVASLWRAHRMIQRGWTMADDEYQAIMHTAASRPEAGEWGGRWYERDPTIKGMPMWAELAWRATRALGPDRMPMLAAVMRRAAYDPTWVAELEGLAMLLSGAIDGDVAARMTAYKHMGDAVRAYIIDTVRVE